MTIESIIPLRAGRPTDKRASTCHRALMFDAFADGPPAIYGRRWPVETANSMMKRNDGSALRARSPQRREREMLLKPLS